MAPGTGPSGPPTVPVTVAFPPRTATAVVVERPGISGRLIPERSLGGGAVVIGTVVGGSGRWTRPSPLHGDESP